MGRINGRRVLLGGLLAGLVSNVSGITLAHFVLREDLMALMRAAGISSFPAHVGVQHITTRLAIGIAVVWLYAAIRPRFGPGPKTAVYAGLIGWFFAQPISALALSTWGIIPTRVLVVATLWGLFEMTLVALAGAWVYKE